MTIHYDVTVVNPERAKGVRMMLHIPTSEVPKLLRALADHLVSRWSTGKAPSKAMASVPMDGNFHEDSGVTVR